jgi:hypothetical protein
MALSLRCLPIIRDIRGKGFGKRQNRHCRPGEQAERPTVSSVTIRGGQGNGIVLPPFCEDELSRRDETNKPSWQTEKIMLTRVLAKFRPTPSMTVSLLALIVALGGAGYAANGGAFVLGGSNSATTESALTATFNGKALRLSNTSAGASASALALSVAMGHPPMTVNTVTKVTNLNADYVDGLDSTALTRVHNVPYNLAAGARSAPINVPPNRPVQIVGVNLASGDQGLGQASLLTTPAGLFQWAGLDSYGSLPPAITGFATGAAGQTIVFIDFQHKVAVETAAPGTIKIHNANSGPQFGSISLMW